MIGGTDIVIPAKGDSETLDACVRMIREFWPEARFEDALTGEKYSRYTDVPIERLGELFVYPDVIAETLWDRGDANAAANSMVYLVLSPENVTVVADDPTAEPIKSMLESIRRRPVHQARNRSNKYAVILPT